MATNIIEAVQQGLEYPPLQKVDPNIQETKDKYVQSSEEKLGQAAIPAVLAGLYRLSRTDDGCEKIIHAGSNEGWLHELFSVKEQDAVQKVAQYAGTDENHTKVQMELIANQSVIALKKAVGEDAAPDKLKKYMNGQRHNILVYLPAAMALGDLLNDEGLDDRTNKMEGPVSNFMHKIENILSGGS